MDGENTQQERLNIMKQAERDGGGGRREGRYMVLFFWIREQEREKIGKEEEVKG